MFGAFEVQVDQESASLFLFCDNYIILVYVN